MASLITAYEVVKYSPAGRDYPTTHICNRIPIEEETLRNRCFGEDFWAYMESKLTPLPTTAVEWEDNGSYADGDFVIRDTCLYESLVNANTSDPLTDETNWSKFKKFTEDCLNTFWESYLRPYLAFKTYSGSLLYTTHNSGAGGLTIRSDDGGRGNGTRVANKGELGNTNNQLLADAQDIYDNMIVWLKKNRSSCEFPTIKLFDDNCGADCIQRKQTRRWAFRKQTAW